MFGTILLILSSTVLASNYNIIVSENSDRSNSVPLESSLLAGPIYIQVMDDPNIDRVSFYLDTQTDTPYRTEYHAPFDMAGPNYDGTASALDTSELLDGSHYIHVSVVLTDGSVITETAFFIIDNALSSYDYLSVDLQRNDPVLSKSSQSIATSSKGSSSFTFVNNDNPDRSNPYQLQSSTLSGNAYIELVSSIQIKKVAFFLDTSPDSTSSAIHNERNAPYAFAGDNFFKKPHPFDTRSVSDGVHTVFALITLEDNSVVTASSDFYISNSSSDFSVANNDTSNTGKTSISWSAPTERESGFKIFQSEIKKYIIFYGVRSHIYTDFIEITEKTDNVLPTSALIDQLEPGVVYYFSGITVDSNGISSILSNEVSRYIEP